MNKINCCICDTPFQLFTCLNIFYGNNSGETDLFLGNAFQDNGHIVRRLKEAEIFRHIYFYDVNEYENSIFRSVSNKFQRIIKPGKYVERVVKEQFVLREQKYTDVYISMAFRFSIAFVLSCSDATLHYYDDGLGSYFGKIYEHSIDCKWKLLYGLFGVSYKRLYPDVRHVYSAVLCKSEMTGQLVEIPKDNYLNEAYRSLFKDVFEYERNELYDRKTMVYLTRPNDFKKEQIDVIDTELEKKLLSYGEECLLRVHPRDLRKNAVSIDKDEMLKLWELVCLDSVREDMSLIGWFSTAQFIPKILYDMEPEIVLTFPMYKECFADDWMRKYFQFTEDVRDLYRDKNKIVLINSMEEFEQYLSGKCNKSL